MSREYLELGSAPADEECAQVGQPNYSEQGRAECKRYIELLRKVVGVEPQGARLIVKSNPHDFGEYFEVVCCYNEHDEEAVKYAFRLDAEAPTKWDV